MWDPYRHGDSEVPLGPGQDPQITHVYVVLMEDRQHGVDVDPYKNKQDAIEEARRIAKDNATQEEDIREEELNQGMIDDGWVIDIHYSIEEDKVCVMRRELQ